MLNTVSHCIQEGALQQAGLSYCSRALSEAQ